jgi:hypothetical protein
VQAAEHGDAPGLLERGGIELERRRAQNMPALCAIIAGVPARSTRASTCARSATSHATGVMSGEPAASFSTSSRRRAAAKTA